MAAGAVPYRTEASASDLAQGLPGDDAPSGSDRFQIAIEAFPGGFILFGPDERLVACNSTYRLMYPRVAPLLHVGASFGDVLWQAIRAGAYGDCGETPERFFEQRLRSFRARRSSSEQRLADGRWVRIDERRTADGSSVGLRIDISDMKRREDDLATALERAGEAEAATARQAAMLSAILRELPDGAQLFDAAGRLVGWNDLAFRLNGFDAAAQQGILASGNPARAFRMALATRGDYGPGDPATLVAEREGKAGKGVATHFRRRGHGGRWLELRGVPTPEGGWLGLYRDITAEVTREEKLAAALTSAEAASKAKGDFLANTSHELRTPLNAIIGFADLMASGTAGPLTAEQAQYVDFIRSGGAHLLAIINDILDLSKVEAGKLPLHCEETDLHRLLEAGVQYLKLAAEARDVSILRDYRLADPVLSVDPVRLRQIVINLLANAIKFSDAGSAVTIATRLLPQGEVEIAITDRGIGMDAAELEVALEPFGQVESGLDRRFEGTGLGLPLARRLVEAHGGTLHVASVKGSGTTVSLTLPATHGA